MTSAGDKGREAENFTAQFLIVNGWPYVERRTKKGRLDQGDITGTPGLMWEVKYLGRNRPIPMAAWMKETDVQTVNAKADYGILVIKPPGVGERNAGKFWAVMRYSAWWELGAQAYPNGKPAPPVHQYPHSNAKLTQLSAKIAELDRIPGHEWVISIPSRIFGVDGLAVMTLERIVPLLHQAGYGGSYVLAGRADGSVGGSETG